MIQTSLFLQIFTLKIDQIPFLFINNALFNIYFPTICYLEGLWW